jgi:hypothetical protein
MKRKGSHNDKTMGWDNTNTNNKGADDNNNGDQVTTMRNLRAVSGTGRLAQPSAAVSNCLQGGGVCKDGDDHETMVGTKTRQDYTMTRAPGMVTVGDGEGDENEMTMMAITIAPPTTATSNCSWGGNGDGDKDTDECEDTDNGP